MKVSVKGMYALVALIDLAIFSKERLVKLNQIAKRQKFSIKYLEQIFTELKKAGIVKSVLGATGGYMLANETKNITLKMIFEATEGNLSCKQDKLLEDKIMNLCMQKYIYDKIDKTVFGFLEGYTLYDMVSNYNLENQKDVPMFYI